MFSLTQSQRVRGSSGEPLPVVYQSLADLGVVFRRGELVLVCAAPGIGKSAFTLSYALKSRSSTMYFSADSNAFSQLTRSISVVTKKTMHEAGRLVLDGQIERIGKDLGSFPIRFDYNANPTLDDIQLGLEAYEEVYGDYPDIVIVDNATNVRIEGDTEDNEYSGLEGLMDWLHGVGRETQACVFALHHVTGPFNNGDKPIPQGGVKGQITRVPELVLTLHKPAPNVLAVSPVKNRGGEPDSSGYTYAELSFDGSRMLIEDLN